MPCEQEENRLSGPPSLHKYHSNIVN